MPKMIGLAAAAVAVACLALAPAASPVPSPLRKEAPGHGDAAKLRKAVTVQGMKQHEQAFQNIATANGGTRASGTPGYDASVAYVVGQLEAAGYDPRRAGVRLPVLPGARAAGVRPHVAPTPRRSTSPTDDFATMTYSGSGNVTAAVQEVNDNQFPPGPDAELVERGLRGRGLRRASCRATSR